MMNATALIRPHAYEGVPPAAIAALTGLPQDFVAKTTARLRERGEPVPRIRARRSASKMTVITDPDAFAWVLREVIAKHGTTIKDVLSRSHFKEHVVARHEVMRRCRFELGMSYPQIGRKLNRDHSSVYGACMGRSRARS